MRHDEKTIIIVAGGLDGGAHDGIFLDSVEIYNPTDNTWYLGKTNSQLQKTFYNYYRHPPPNTFFVAAKKPC